MNVSKPAQLVHVVRMPVSGSRTDRPPLVVLLHGVGGNEQQMSAIADVLDPRFIVISVRSPLILGPSSFGWFHVRFTPDGPSIAEHEAADAWKRIAAFTRDAVKTYDADPARVYVGGFSQGGIVALAALLTAPDVFKGAFSMSGRLLPEVLPHVAEGSAGRPVLLVHGVRDETLGIHLARWADEQLRARNVRVTYREFPMGHEITAGSLGVVRSWLTEQLDSSEDEG